MKHPIYALMVVLLATLVGIVASGCSTQQLASAQGNLARLQTIVVDGCLVVQPSLQSAALLDPQIAAVATANGLVCTAASTISPTSVQSIITTGIPAIETAVNASTFIPPEQKPLITAALGIFQLTLTNALAAFGPVTAPVAPTAPTPASGV